RPRGGRGGRPRRARRVAQAARTRRAAPRARAGRHGRLHLGQSLRQPHASHREAHVEPPGHGISPLRPAVLAAAGVLGVPAALRPPLRAARGDGLHGGADRARRRRLDAPDVARGCGGRIVHSVAYRRPEPYAGRRVLVVGVGNSGAEIASEIARAGAGTRVTIAVRSGANVVPLTLAGLPIQYVAYWVRKLPRRAQEGAVALVRLATELARGAPVLPRPPHSPLDAIPVIGFHLVDAIREGLVDVRAGIAELTADGARFTDGTAACFDDIILATGFRAALGPLGSLVQTDAHGFARRRDRVVSLDQPRLYFVGHNYDATGGLYNINRDARLAARLIAADLARPRP